MNVTGRVVTVMGSIFLILLLVAIPISGIEFPEISALVISTAFIFALICIRRSAGLLLARNDASRAPPR